MAIAFVQKTQTSGTSVSSPATLAYVSNNSAGNLLIAISRAVNHDGVNAGTVNFTDSQGNSWTNLQTNTVTTTSTFQVSYAPNAKAGANTVTATIATGNDSEWAVLDFVIFEFSGTATTSPVDQSSVVNTGTGTAAAGTAVTTTSIGMVIESCCNDTLGPATPISASSGFSVVQDSDVNVCLIAQINSSIGTYTPTITLNASATWRTFTTAFKILSTAVATPTFSPVAGTYTQEKDVTINDTNSALPGFAMYYTVDGSTPTTSSTPYTGPVHVAVSLTLKAIAVATGLTNSAVGSAAYVINIPAPSNPSGGLPVSYFGGCTE